MTNIRHTVAIDERPTAARARCLDCAFVTAWCTTEPPWPDAPRRPFGEVKDRAVSLANGHLRDREVRLPTQGSRRPSWEIA